MDRPKIVIQYPYIPLYRVPVFERLSRSDQYEYTFWSSKESPYKFLRSSYDESTLKIVEVPLKLVKLPLTGRTFELQFAAVKKLITERPAIYIILANPNSLSSWISMAIARMLGCRVLAWSHGYLSDERGIKGWVRKLYYKLAHGHLLYGNKAKEIMLEKGFCGQELDVIYNSLDYDSQSRYRNSNSLEDRIRTRSEYGIGAEDIVLIAIGRLLPKLKLDQAIEGISLLDKAGQRTYLLIIGDGPERRQLEQKADELGVSSRVIFYGECHDESQLSPLYNVSDLSIVMGKVGLSAMHSLAYGVPMLTNSSIAEHFPEIEAVVEGVTGWYFEKDNVSEFAAKVRPIDYKGEYYNNCVKMIEAHYTPAKQVVYIEQAIRKYL